MIRNVAIKGDITCYFFVSEFGSKNEVVNGDIVSAGMHFIIFNCVW